MIYYYVNVVDRISGESVTVGAMLTLEETRELIKSLKKFNATDFEIVRGIEKL